MLRVLSTFLSATVLMMGTNYCKQDLDVPNGEKDFEYSYVCVDNRLFLQVYFSKGYGKGVGLSQVDNKRCECVRENKTYRNVLGFEVNEIVDAIKIK